MKEEYTKKEACEYLGISEARLNSYIKNSQEIEYFKKGNRFYFRNEELKRWKSLQENRRVILTLDDYRKCLEFAFKINYSGHTRSDFGSARTRGVLQAVSNWTQGVLGEIALKIFLERNFNIFIDLDLDVHGAVVGQDITQVRKGRVINPPRIRVSIKSGKLNGCFIVVPSNEVELKERCSDYYIFVRIDFPEDHLLRVLREHEFLENVKDLIPDINNITAYVCGYVKVDELKKVGSIPGIEFNGMRYVANVGKLHNSDDDWKYFAEML